MKMTTKEIINQGTNLVHNEILSIYDSVNCNPKVKILYESLKYHFSSRGKMLRPAFMFAVNCDLNGIPSKVGNFALALELIHNYSLIHDDLPSMDDDDYRRGKLTVHKKYDEATAILLGDFLLTKAFEYASKTNYINDEVKTLECINVLARNANDFGMLGGQIIDLNPSALNKPEKVLKMYELKTSALFKTAFVIPGILNGIKDEEIELLSEIGKDFGLFFQIKDDLSDIIEDELVDKVTILKYWNEDEVYAYLNKLKNQIVFNLESLKLTGTKEYMEKIYE